METINIINNYDQKIITQNILITNQKKLIVRCKNLFKFEFLNKENLLVEEVMEYINKQKFINWDLFIDLINLDFEIYKSGSKTKLNSLEYLIETKSTKLIEFLLTMDLNSEQNTINWISSDKNIFLLLFKNFYSNNAIINKIIDLMIKNNWIHLFNNLTTRTNNSILFYSISKCSESIILKMLENKLIEIDWKDNYSNNLIHWACKRNYLKLFDWIFTNYPDNQLYDTVNKGGRAPIHIACIKNNLCLTKLLEEKNIEPTIDSNSKTHIHYGIKYGSKDLVLYLLKEYIETDFNFDHELFYDVITFQDEEVVEYFISNTNLKINDSNLFWTMGLFYQKQMYSQIIEYSKKKLSYILYNFLYELSHSYDGHRMDDFFDDDVSIYKM
jgi:ankyrin repeat protein